MRISENTPSRLKLSDRTLWISLICLCAAMIFIARFAFDLGQPSLLIPAALFLAFATVFLRSTDVTFDKIERSCDIRRLDVLRLTRTRLAFEDISDARVEIARMQSDSSVICCRLSLVTASALLPLTAAYEPDQERYGAMRDAVLDAVFAHRTRPADVDPVRTLVKEGRIIDAVTVLRKREGLDLTSASARVDELRKQLHR